MKKYSEIKLTDEEKNILEWFKGQEYNVIGRTTNYGFLEVLDDAKDIRCNLKPMRKPFEFIENGERYEIEKLLNPQHGPKSVWELENGDKYWYLDSFGFYCDSDWSDCVHRIKQRNQGNVFLTKEEAEFEAKRREVAAKVRKYARPFKYNCENWYPYWNFNASLISRCFDNIFKSARDYFESAKQIDRAIAEVGEEDFKKYYLGVTD